MAPNTHRLLHHPRAAGSSQRGFVIAGVLLLVAVLAVLGLSMALTFKQADEDLAREAQTMQLYHLGKAVSQLVLYDKYVTGSICSNLSLAPASYPDLRFKYTCSGSTHTEGGISEYVSDYVILVCNGKTACPDASPGPGYVEREFRISLIK